MLTQVSLCKCRYASTGIFISIECSLEYVQDDDTLCMLVTHSVVDSPLQVALLALFSDMLYRWVVLTYLSSIVNIQLTFNLFQLCWIIVSTMNYNCNMGSPCDQLIWHESISVLYVECLERKLCRNGDHLGQSQLLLLFNAMNSMH